MMLPTSAGQKNGGVLYVLRYLQAVYIDIYIAQSHIPANGPFSENIRIRLFDDYQRYKSDNPNSPVPDMSGDIFASIIDRMSTLYQTVTQAASSQHLVALREAPEAAMRSAWDNVLKAMWCPKNSVSTTFMYVFH